MKTSPPYYSPRSLRDLRFIFAYIQQDNPQAAKEFLSDFDAAVQRIGLFPLSGSRPRHKRLRERRLRYVVLGNYLLFYSPESRRLRVLRVLHSKQDYVFLL